jgi:hypothetical protein
LTLLDCPCGDVSASAAGCGDGRYPEAGVVESRSPAGSYNYGKVPMLTISDLGSLGEFFGSIAVFATLLYLVTEIRMTRRATMAQIYQMRADAASAARASIGASPSQALAVHKFRNLVHGEGMEAALAGCTEAEIAQAVFYFSAQIHRIDNIHYQYSNGLVDEELYNATVIQGIRQNGRIWRHFHLLDSQRKSFVALIEEIIGTGE